MKAETVINYYKTQTAAAAALGIRRQAVCKWRKTGIVPIGRAYELQAITGGALKVDKSVYHARH